MLQLDNVTFSYDNTVVLREVNLALPEGELTLVAGRTGSGKSTLLGMFNGLVPHFSGGTLAGDVRVAGTSIKGVAPRDLADRVGFVPQDPASGFVTDIVEDELAFGMEQLGLDPQTMRRRVEETLDLLGIAELRHRALRTLSGGQQQRVAIGAVLTMHPDVLVLDEPTSALDPTAAEEVLATIARLVDDLGMTVVLAEHRMERVVPFADRLVLIDDGRVRSGDPAELLRDAPVAPPIVELGRLAGWEPLALSVRAARRQGAALREKLGSPPEQAVRQWPDLALDARRVRVVFGSVVAVRDVDLEVGVGEVVVVMGRNGAGKSSLLWAARDDAPTQVGLVPQTAADLLYLETVSAECATADQQSGSPGGTCMSLLNRLAPGVDPAMHPRDLSEGQRLALVLAIVLTAEPQVVALDEPTRGLDYAGKTQLAEILRDLADRGHGIVLSTHDVEFAAHIADTVMVMADGDVVSRGPASKVLSESPAFAPQVTKILGPGWLTVEQVGAAL